MNLKSCGQTCGLFLKDTTIDNLLEGISSSFHPQCTLNMIASKFGFDEFQLISREFWRRIWVQNKPLNTEDDLNEAFNSSKISLNLDLHENLFLNDEWCTKLNENHKEAINSKCFGIPWTVLHFENENNISQNKSKVFFGVDSWPLICSYLKIPQKLFGDVLLLN
ncbi:hypothetical protein Mgra_00003928 [Meloidogyne graminicola]|uniref:DSBA-like thioredoxin domain-containing protein n=1 Tax=Meloidogyne graminicola TaxID=189291 RepID=A0A8S9ZU77_9BILA|nr:hypothetical protein Mgra_00003928 [Meloidogyne graminicola]